MIYPGVMAKITRNVDQESWCSARDQLPLC